MRVHKLRTPGSREEARSSQGKFPSENLQKEGGLSVPSVPMILTWDDFVPGITSVFISCPVRGNLLQWLQETSAVGKRIGIYSRVCI